ncbi:MAG: DUF3108 domain-containing protein [Gemmatimonadota bacterium]
MRAPTLGLLLLLGALPPGLAAQATSAARDAPIQAPSPVTVPFRVGEALEYTISYAFLDAGTMRLAVEGVEEVDGRPAYHLRFEAQTNSAISAIYSLKDLLQSWMDVERLHSVRFIKESVEKGKRRDRSYTLDQTRRVRVDDQTGEEKPMPAGAQDDLSIFYFLRTLPLEEGKRFTLNNLMDPDDNPMRVTVVGSEPVKVPAGRFDCFVLRLDVHTDSGVFSQGGEVKVWMTKDPRRILTKLESKVSVGSFSAVLTQLTPGRQASPAAALSTSR